MAQESMILLAMEALRDMGFFDFFLPFMLFFAVVFGALQKTKVFGEPSEHNVVTINSIVSLVIAFIASTTAWVIGGLKGFLPWVGFISIVVIAFLMLLAMIWGGNLEELIKSKYFVTAAGIIVSVALFLVLFFVLGFAEYFAAWSITETDIALVIIGIIAIAVFAVIIKSGGESESSSSK